MGLAVTVESPTQKGMLAGASVALISSTERASTDGVLNDYTEASDHGSPRPEMQWELLTDPQVLLQPLLLVQCYDLYIVGRSLTRNVQIHHKKRLSNSSLVP